MFFGHDLAEWRRFEIEIPLNRKAEWTTSGGEFG
jgi:hypothetical protein